MLARNFSRQLVLGLWIIASLAASRARAGEAVVRSARSGPWSSPRTWEGGKVPDAGARVQIRAGHGVIYDVASDAPLRWIHVAGTLSFSRGKDTALTVGLIKIEPGDSIRENGAECESHGANASGQMPALEVGTPDAPIPAGKHALIRLAPIEGQDKENLPAIVACGGRLDLHGAPMNRTWVKLGEPTYRGDPYVKLQEPVTGWRVGDQLIVTTTTFIEVFAPRPDGGRMIPSLLDNTQTEEVRIKQIGGDQILFDKPLKFEHYADGRYRGEVANLSRNVVVESSRPDVSRGHTMYHFGSRGSISYAELRHLGKQGVLARYPVHFHQARDSMRGTSVIGASIWDSGNRFIAIHDTDYILVRDTVGYRSAGHGFFLEDGTEEFNVFDRNLAVQALIADPLPKQALPTDLNDGAGFWWANSLNSFTRNVAVECSQYGYRYQIRKEANAPVEMPVRQNDGSTKTVDVRTLPFLRFESNEAHSQRRFSLNLGGFNALGDDRDIDRDGNVLDRMKFIGGDVQGVGPDDAHPFVIRDFLAWRAQWGFTAGTPNVRFDGFDCWDVAYGVWRSNFAGHEYNGINFHKMHTSGFLDGYAAGNNRYAYLRFLRLDDVQPPVTVITRVRALSPALLEVSGIAADDNTVREVLVNGKPATLTPGLVADWTALVPVQGNEISLEAAAEDTAGNRELTPHKLAGSMRDLLALQAVPDTRPAQAPAMASEDEDDEYPAPAMPAKPGMTAVIPNGSTQSPRAIALAAVDKLNAHPRWPLWDGKEAAAAWAKRNGFAATKTVQLNGEKLELVLVPPNQFVMGSETGERGRQGDEGPLRGVVITRPYYLGRTEVTQAQYQAVTGKNPSYFRGAALPVDQVSWLDASAFAQQAGHGLRLPTEAEWEAACRASTETPFSSGATLAELAGAAWFGHGPSDLDAEGNEGTSHPVASKKPNPLGLYDMHGNVYEWVADAYAIDAYQDGAAIDPQGPSLNARRERVLRGGSWESGPQSLRSANRDGYPETSKGYTLGFRVAMPAEPEGSAGNASAAR